MKIKETTTASSTRELVSSFLFAYPSKIYICVRLLLAFCSCLVETSAVCGIEIALLTPKCWNDGIASSILRALVRMDRDIPIHKVLGVCGF